MHIFWPVYEKLYKAVFGRLGKWALSYKKIEINCICCDLPGFFAGCQAHALLSCLRLLLCCPIQIHRNKRFPQKPKTDKNIFGVFSCNWGMADCQRVYSRVVWSLQRSPVHDACEPSRWDKLFQLLLLHYLLPGVALLTDAGFIQWCEHPCYLSLSNAEIMTRPLYASWAMCCSMFLTTMDLETKYSSFCNRLQKRKLKSYIPFLDGMRGTK